MEGVGAQDDNCASGQKALERFRLQIKKNEHIMWLNLSKGFTQLAETLGVN